METVSGEVAQLRRCQHAEAETARQRLTFLAEASTWLAASLNYETTLIRLPRLVVPFLADWCVVYAVEAEPSPHLVALAHVDPMQEDKLREMRRRYPLEPHGPHPVMQVSCRPVSQHSTQRCLRPCW